MIVKIISACLGVITGVVIVKIVFRMAVKLLDKIYGYTSELFIQGHSAWEFLKEGVFSRLGNYIGHGLCYEASALVMLSLRDYEQTRMVFGKSYSRKYRERVKHCWVEMKSYGIWWTVDPTWVAIIPVPRLFHTVRFLAGRDRIMSHEEFWSYEFSKKYYDLLKDPKTSYLFHALVGFRREDEGTKMLFEKYDGVLSAVDGDKYSYYGLMDIFGGESHPITRRMINEFLVKPKRVMPKKRTYRKAMMILKKRNKIIEQQRQSSA